MNNNCAILITSCDAYEDAWDPFFSLLEIMWPDCPYPVYLNTESKTYFRGKTQITCLHPESLTDQKGKPISWSNRLKQAVNKIESDYILFFLEDFFLQSPVRGEMVEKAVAWMEQDKAIGLIRFFRDPHLETIEQTEFAQIDPNYDYAINTMVGLWRKDFLLSILRDENPWDFEFFGTGRWRRTNVKIYTHCKEFPKVFDYEIDPDAGYGIFQGKWLRGNVALFEKNGITVDYEQRGFWDQLPDLKAREREKNWFLHDVQRALKDPKALAHYLKCTYDVGKDKLAHIRQKFFNP